MSNSDEIKIYAIIILKAVIYSFSCWFAIIDLDISRKSYFRLVILTLKQ